METVLKEKLWAYIVHNNPDLMISLQERQSINQYLDEKVNEVMPMAERLSGEGKPQYLIEELCLNAMTAELKPSRYHYIRSVLEEEFPNEYERMKDNGTLTYEVVNLIAQCKDIFIDFDFSRENEADRHLRHAIIARIHSHLA